MKLTARKTMVALGTAVAVSLAPVTGAVITTPVAVAATEYNYGQVLHPYNLAEKGVIANNGKIKQLTAELAKVQVTAIEALSKKSEAEIELAQAKVYNPELSEIQVYEEYTKEDSTKDSKENKAAIDALNGYKKSADEANLHLTKAKNAIEAARAAQKKADDDKFVCEGAVNKGGNADEGSSEGMSSDMTSSGSRIVIKDGKKKCVSNFEYYSDKLTKLVAVLGTLFTLVTTVTKISSQFQKLAPAV